jgi:hypothetical protein
MKINLTIITNQSEDDSDLLTKRLFLGLPTAAFVFSNLYPGGRSALAEKLDVPADWSAAWKRAVKAEADPQCGLST